MSTNPSLRRSTPGGCRPPQVCGRPRSAPHGFMPSANARGLMWDPGPAEGGEPVLAGGRPQPGEPRRHERMAGGAEHRVSDCRVSRSLPLYGPAPIFAALTAPVASVQGHRLSSWWNHRRSRSEGALRPAPTPMCPGLSRHLTSDGNTAAVLPAIASYLPRRTSRVVDQVPPKLSRVWPNVGLIWVSPRMDGHLCPEERSVRRCAGPSTRQNYGPLERPGGRTSTLWTR